MTGNVFGEMAKKQEGEPIDAWDPKNVANLVTFLATPESAGINGLTFFVFDGTYVR